MLCHLHNQDPKGPSERSFQKSLCIGGVSHCPVDDNVEQKTRHNMALLDACLYRKKVRCPSVFNNAEGDSTIKLLYDVDKVVRNVTMPKNVSD